MAEREVEVPLIPQLIKRISEILVSNGLTRRPIVKGDTIEATGEAGIGKFFITQENISNDRAILLIDARNDEAIEIISNLMETGLEDLMIEIKDQLEQEEQLAQEEKSLKKELTEESGDNEAKEIKGCLVCQGSLEEVGTKDLLEDLKVSIMVCSSCNKVEFYKRRV